VANDRLDGTERRSFLYEAFTLPGRIILWVKYMNPPKEYGDARAIARRAKSPIMTFIYSFIFWLLAAFVSFLILCELSSPSTYVTPPHPPTKIEYEYAAEYNDDDGIERR